MKSRISLAALLMSLALAGCGGVDVDPTYSNKDHDAMYKNGSLLSEEGGLNLFGDDNKKTADNAGIGVNAFLWRATLDTISFMPLVSADPFGGVIITDWYSAAQTPNERLKLNVYIRDRDLHADGIKVSVFRQIRDPKGAWADAPSAPTTATELENAILTKARQIRMAQKQFQ